MAIQRIRSMAMHKNLVIKVLREHPEDVEQFTPSFDNAEDAIKALEDFPGHWIIGGELVPDVVRETCPFCDIIAHHERSDVDPHCLICGGCGSAFEPIPY